MNKYFLMLAAAGLIASAPAYYAFQAQAEEAETVVEAVEIDAVVDGDNVVIEDVVVTEEVVVEEEAAVDEAAEETTEEAAE